MDNIDMSTKQHFARGLENRSANTGNNLRATKFSLLVVLLILSWHNLNAQSQTGSQSIDEKLSGNGLAYFDFFYAGEAKSRNMYIVKQGKITWSYIDTVGRGEISDAILMKNGNVLFAHQYGVTLINRDKKILWQYMAPDGFEVHTAQPIGKKYVVFVQNGNPCKVIVANLVTNVIEKQFVIPFKSGTHGQIRHARLTSKGTLLIAHMDLGKIIEYDIDGKQLLSMSVPSPWSAVELKNGHILTVSNLNFVKEFSRSGETLWDCNLRDIAGYKITNPQLALRLSNGNTLINNWFNQWDGKLDNDNLPVQAIELTPDRKVVWALRSWKFPADLGPSTTIQLLDRKSDEQIGTFFGNFR
jgi:hypothetical protein